MTDADVGLNSTLGIGNGASPEVFTSIAEVVSINGPSFTAAAVDMTHLNPTDDYAEYSAGILDGGEVTFEGRWIPTNATHNDDSGGLLDILESRALNNYKLTFPDGSDFTFAAIVTGLNPSIGGHSDPVNMSVTLKVSGKPTLTQSA